MKQPRSTAWKAMERSRSPFYRKAEREFKRALMAQLAPLIDYVNEKGIPSDDVIDMLIKEDPVLDKYKYVYKDAGTAYAEKLYSNFASGEDLQREFRSFMENFVKNNCTERITSVTNMSKAKARGVINDVIAAMPGEDEFDVGRQIKKSLEKQGGKISKWRARMIARTEVVSASNAGQQIGAEAANVPMKKTWVSTMDDRVRDRHARMNGVSVGLENDFIVGGEPMNTPGDPRASAGNTVNCRCTVSYQPIPVTGGI